MILKYNKEITEIYIRKNTISEVYLGKFLIWQSIRSCFGSGYWINEKPWINTDIWKNN